VAPPRYAGALLSLSLPPPRHDAVCVAGECISQHQSRCSVNEEMVCMAANKCRRGGGASIAEQSRQKRQRGVQREAVGLLSLLVSCPKSPLPVGGLPLHDRCEAATTRPVYPSVLPAPRKVNEEEKVRGFCRKTRDDSRVSHDSCPREVSRYPTQQVNQPSSPGCHANFQNAKVREPKTPCRCASLHHPSE
jgi:hypothetical protein